jgi:hypothetical protein
LRDYLLGLSLKPKTVKNILGSLRALVLDARERTDYVPGAPFATMKWPRTPVAEPDPFDASERDRVIGWFRDRKPHYYPFVLTLFRTGMRPSEATNRMTTSSSTSGRAARSTRASGPGSSGTDHCGR